MEVYYVYSLKTKVAHHFYYKTDLLFRFLKTYDEKSYQKEIVDQFSYVTNKIEMRKLINHVTNVSDYVQTTEIQPNCYHIFSGTKSVYIHVLDTYFQIKCPSIYDAEQLLFEPLRLLPPHLFVIHAQKPIYGWISTMKNERESNNRQTL